MAEAVSALARSMNQYGPVLTIVCSLMLLNGFFIWRDYKREARQQEQLELAQEQSYTVITECKEMIAGCKEVITQNSKIMERWLQHVGR